MLLDFFDGPFKNCGGGHARESRMYNNGPCMICTWTIWGAWSGRSKSCGSELRTRKRMCRCEDGTSGIGSKCGGGFSNEAKVDTKEACTSYKDYWDWRGQIKKQNGNDQFKPKPYHAKGNIKSE